MPLSWWRARAAGYVESRGVQLSVSARQTTKPDRPMADAELAAQRPETAACLARRKISRTMSDFASA